MRDRQNPRRRTRPARTRGDDRASGAERGGHREPKHGPHRIGHLITDDGHDWLIEIHVPLTFVIFGLTIWITAQAITLARREPR
ncbi:MAG: hypothetical protein WCD11_06225 [Solirubrobacteraceae bacterium]